MAQTARLANRPQDYKRLGIIDTIEPFEDGLRTDPSQPGHYEWWYFDTHLDNGSRLVVSFFTKDAASPDGGCKPTIVIDLDLPDGTSVSRRAEFTPADFSASTGRCDVCIGDNRFTGDLHQYRITATIEDLSIDVELTGQTESWRPGTGVMFFGDDDSGMFAWLASVPYGAVRAAYRVGTESHQAETPPASTTSPPNWRAPERP
jgi:hypothetical protein